MSGWLYWVVRSRELSMFVSSFDCLVVTSVSNSQWLLLIIPQVCALSIGDYAWVARQKKLFPQNSFASSSAGDSEVGYESDRSSVGYSSDDSMSSNNSVSRMSKVTQYRI